MARQLRLLPLVAALLVAACSDGSNPVTPDLPIEVPPPQLAVVDGGQVNVSMSVTPVPCSGEATVTIQIQGTPAPSSSNMNVMLVLDESGSISAQNFARVRDAAADFVESLDFSRTRVGIVLFSSGARTLITPTNSKVALLNAIHTMTQQGGSTNTVAGLTLAWDQIRFSSGGRALVLMTDGNATVGVQDLRVTSNNIRNQGGTIFAVGVGNQVDEAELDLIATPGYVYLIADFQALTAAFLQIADEVASPASGKQLQLVAPVASGFSFVPGSGTVSAGTPLVLQAPQTVRWYADRIGNETITITFRIQLQPGAQPVNGLLPAVTNASLQLKGPIFGQTHFVNPPTLEAQVDACDTTPPDVVPTLTGTQGTQDRYVSDVDLTWSVTDDESLITVQVGCDPVTISSDGASYSYTCSATSAGGTASETVTFQRDASPPTVAYTGNAGTYSIGDQVSITCAASDNLSGVASTTCADIAGPAWSFGAGASFSAEATDHAGNVGSAAGSFTVQVTFGGLCGLVQQWATNAGVANSLCAKLSAAEKAAARGNTHARDGSMNAFVNEVNAQAGKKIPGDKATLLVSFARALMP